MARVRSITCATAVLLLCHALRAEAQAWPAWYEKFEPRRDLLLSYSITGMALDSNGAALIAGTASTNGSAAPSHVLVGKFHSTGEPAWLSLVRPAPGESVAPVGVVTDSVGNCYVAGTAILNFRRVALLLKHSPHGELLWGARNEETNGWNRDITALAISPSDEIFLCGRESSASALLNFLVIKFDSAGRQLWRSTYDGPDHNSDAAESILALADGGCVVGGNSIGIATRKDYLLARYNASGNLVWTARHNTAGTGNETLVAMTQDLIGNIYVTGYSVSSNASAEMVTVKYNAEGKELWAARDAGPKNGLLYPVALAVDAEHNVYLTGESEGAIMTLKYDANGTIAWQARYRSADTVGDSPQGLALDEAGNVYIAGTSSRDLGFGRFSRHVVMVGYASDGRERLSNRHVPCFTETVGATALAMHHTGEVYVAGPDFVIKYGKLSPPELRLEAFRIGVLGFGFTVVGEPGHCYEILSTGTLGNWGPATRLMKKELRDDVFWRPAPGPGVRRFFRARQME